MLDQGEGQKPSPRRGTALTFPEIVGQEELKEALLMVAVDDDLDGLLVRGEKGTAKSTAVRALVDLLPPQVVIEGCPYGCPPGAPARQCPTCRDREDPPTAERPVPLVTLPLGATRERVVGSLSVAGAMEGDYEFEPGLLARANRGVLYVDEVNLLDDHLVDVLLDAAASGVNRVERDGVSVAHPAAFTLVGTMNPEEGDLRPQLRDRFALQASVTACDDVDDRVAIIERALDGTVYDGAERAGRPEEGPDELRRAVRGARERSDDVELPAEFAAQIAELCRDAGLDGHRGDIATARAAVTLAALDGRTTVIRSDVRRAATFAVPHRLQSRPFEEAPDPGSVIDDHFDDGSAADGTEGGGGAKPESGDDGGDGADDGPPTRRESGGEPPSRDGDTGTESGDGSEQAGLGSARTADLDEPGEDVPGSEPAGGDDPDDATPIVPGQTRDGIGEAGAPAASPTDATDEGAAGGGGGSVSGLGAGVESDGPRVRTRPAESGDGVDATASVRAAAARGSRRVESRDLRRSVHRHDGAALVLFVVDASASMRPAIRAAKGCVLELLRDAYRARDRVAFVSFSGDGADVLLPPTDSVTLAARHLKELPTGDRTPLPAGLHVACEVLDRAEPAASVVVLVTDGRANVADRSPVAETREAARGLSERGAHLVVVDAGDGGKAGLVTAITEEAGGERVPLDALSAERIDEAVRVADEMQI